MSEIHAPSIRYEAVVYYSFSMLFDQLFDVACGISWNRTLHGQTYQSSIHNYMLRQ
jgi:hypothetical protein